MFLMETLCFLWGTGWSFGLTKSSAHVSVLPLLWYCPQIACWSLRSVNIFSTARGGVDWLTDYDGVRLCLRTATTNGPTVHSPGDRARRATVMMMMMIPAGDNSWLVHHSSLAVLPAETSGENRRNGRRSENFTYQHLKYLKGSLTCRKILRHGTSGFTSHPKEGLLRICIALKIHFLGRVWICDPWVQWQAH
jgi:hypothetical protein